VGAGVLPGKPPSFNAITEKIRSGPHAELHVCAATENSPRKTTFIQALVMIVTQTPRFEVAFCAVQQ
jgi:hypothetical protein